MKCMENGQYKAYTHSMTHKGKAPLRIIVGIVYLAIGLILYLAGKLIF